MHQILGSAEFLESRIHFQLMGILEDLAEDEKLYDFESKRKCIGHQVRGKVR
jgi:hypothetical protein